MNDIEILNQLEHIEEDKSGESAFLLKGKLEGMRRQIDAYLSQIEGEMLKICIENGPIEIPTGDGHSIKFWAGHEKSVKCKDVRKTLEFLLSIDLGAVEDCLSSSAIRYGAFRDLMETIEHPEYFDQHFATTVKDTLKTGEKLPKQLMTMNTKYLK